MPLYGFIAIILFALMVITAIELVRRSQYELFFIVHQLYIPAVILLCLHVKNVYIGFLPGVILKIIDETTRFMAAYRARNVVACSVEGNVTLICCHLPPSQKKNGYDYENISTSELANVDPKVLPVTKSRENNSIPTSLPVVDYHQLGQWYFLMVSILLLLLCYINITRFIHITIFKNCFEIGS